MKPIARLAFLVAGSALPSCEPQREPPFAGHVSRSAYWEYHNETAEPLCPALLSYLDQHTELVANLLGLSLDRKRPLRYYRFQREEDVAQACRVSAGGCAPDDAVYSASYFDAHEQVHAYVHRAWGYSVPVLEEGEAVALSCSGFGTLDPHVPPFEALGSPAWRDLFGSYTLPWTTYPAVGIWLTYLTRRFGWQAVAELHGRVPWGAAPDDFEQQFAEVIPSSVDATWSEALGTPGAPYCVNDWMCGAPALAIGEERAYCDGQSRATFSVSDQAGVVVSLGGPQGGCHRLFGQTNCYGGAALVACEQGGWPWHTVSNFTPSSSSVHWVLGSPGKYSIQTDVLQLRIKDVFASQPPSELRIESYLPRGFVGDTCESAGVMELDPARDNLIDFMGDIPTGWIRLRGGAGRAFAVWNKMMHWQGVTFDDAPSVCDDCSDGARCTVLSPSWALRMRLAEGAALHIPSGVTQTSLPINAFIALEADRSDDGAP
jgi:hypothetical protein